MIYAELYRREILKKERLEREKEIEQQAKVDERNRVLGLQQQMNEAKIHRMKELTEQEKQMLVFVPFTQARRVAPRGGTPQANHATAAPSEDGSAPRNCAEQ